MMLSSGHPLAAPSRPLGYEDFEFKSWMNGFQVGMGKPLNTSGVNTPSQVSWKGSFTNQDAVLAYALLSKGTRAWIRYDISELGKLGITSGGAVDFAKLHVFDMKDATCLSSILAFFGVLLVASKFAQEVSENVTELLKVELLPARFSPSKKRGGNSTVKATTLFDKLNKYAIHQKYAFGRFIVDIWRCKANKLPDLIHSSKRVKGVKVSVNSVAHSMQSGGDEYDSITKANVSQADEDESFRSRGMIPNTDKSPAWRDLNVRAICQTEPYLTTLFSVYGHASGVEAPVFYLRQLALLHHHIRNSMLNGVGAVNKAICIDDAQNQLVGVFVAAGFTRVKNANPFDNRFGLIDYPPTKKNPNVSKPPAAACGEDEVEEDSDDDEEV